MKYSESNFNGHDNLKLYYRSWLPSCEPKVVLLVVHGLAEHSGRYQETAGFRGSRPHSHRAVGRHAQHRPMCQSNRVSPVLCQTHWGHQAGECDRRRKARRLEQESVERRHKRTRLRDRISGEQPASSVTSPCGVL